MHVDLDFSVLDENKLSYPNEDFISEQFDKDNNIETSNIIVIAGTQRSGSTYLCDHIRSAGVCIPHEYFQPYGYMQALAERWECRKGNSIDIVKYIKSLKLMRTGKAGWLGINIHAWHIPMFKKAMNFLNVDSIHYFHLVRGDILKQAISYEIASQIGNWSSHYSNNIEAKYNYNGILNKIKRIQDGNLDISLFFAEKKIKYKLLFYEDIINKPSEIYNSLSVIGAPIEKEEEANLKKQSSAINKEWAETFVKDFGRDEQKEKKEKKNFLTRLVESVK